MAINRRTEIPEPREGDFVLFRCNPLMGVRVGYVKKPWGEVYLQDARTGDDIPLTQVTGWVSACEAWEKMDD